MKNIHCVTLACLFHAIAAFAAEVTVFGPDGSTAPLVIETIPSDPSKPNLKWTFSAPDGGRRERTVFRVEASTNAVFAAYLDADGNGAYTVGEPFGVSAGRNPPAIDLTETSAVTPRVNLWDASVDTASDRVILCGHDQVAAPSNRFTETSAPARKSRVRVVRYKVDEFNRYTVGVGADAVLDKTFNQGVRPCLHEGDFLSDGKLDIDWDGLYSNVVSYIGVQMAGCDVTNVTYLIVYNWDKASYESDTDADNAVRASSTLVTRRFENTRRVPTALGATTNGTSATFAFRIDGEDKWASWFGTTYTAFKVKAVTISGSTTNDVWSSGIARLPPADADGVYRYTANLPSSLLPVPSSLYYRIALYNAKFKTDSLVRMEKNGDPFSPPKTFGTNAANQ